MNDWLNDVLLPYAQELPLSLLAIIGSFIDDPLPPIPAFPVMVMIGSFARLQDYSLFGLFFLAVLSGAGKVAGAYIVYKIVDKLEDAVVIKFGSKIGIKPGQLESYGEKLNRSGADFVSLIILRSTPFVPGTLVSVAAGLIGVREWVFLVATYLGTVIRNTLYLYVGFYGTVVLKHTLEEVTGWQLALIVTLIISLIALIIYIYLKSRKKD